ncbi:c-type cytochrome [Rhodoblastus sp.]|uniref:c-type cytochrome n=1 Tax=Rhodoblastus sp. TaxID=1962975 RepID=UPI003F9BBFB0
MRWPQRPKPRAGIALSTILLGISACERAGPSPPAGLLASPAAQQAGAALFAAHCAICHGANGEGRGRRREGLNPPPADLTLPPWSEIAEAGGTFRVIRNGVARTAMPAWPVLNDEQIWDLIAYLSSRKS